MSRLFGAYGLKYTEEFLYYNHDAMSANVYADSDGMVFIMEERNCRISFVGYQNRGNVNLFSARSRKERDV